MAREEVKRSLHFMLKVVVADSMGDALVVAVASEEVTKAEEADVDVGVVATAGQNPIFPPDHTLIRSGRFLAIMRRARYFISTIKLNRAR